MAKKCADFEGNCCGSCHDEADEGYSDLLEVYGSDGDLYALVCCGKIDEANRRAEAET